MPCDTFKYFKARKRLMLKVLLLPLLLIIWILIKIGQAPQLIARIVLSLGRYFISTIINSKVIFFDKVESIIIRGKPYFSAMNQELWKRKSPNPQKLVKVKLYRGGRLKANYLPPIPSWDERIFDFLIEKFSFENFLIRIKTPNFKLPNFNYSAWRAINRKRERKQAAYSFIRIAKPQQKSSKRGFKLNFKLNLPTFEAPKLPAVNVNLSRLIKRGRGRPRTTPIHIYLSRKIKRFFDIVFPTPLRIGTVVIIVASIFFGYSFYLVTIAHDLPNPEKLSSLPGPLTTEFYDRKGRLLYKLYEGRNRSLVELKNLSPHLINATIAVEDKNFYGHLGFDFFGIARAVVAYLEDNQVQGGSTITQQLIKNTLLTSERTLERKVKEVMLAFWTERIYTKDQILKMYFNEVPYGGTAWGIKAASEVYFGKDPKELNLAESAYLAGLPASPTTYSPYGAHPELAKNRQKDVLKRMVEDGYISQQEADKAYDEQLSIRPPQSGIKAPHFVMYVRLLLAEKYGEKVVSQGGLKVMTSLDLDIQEMAEQVVKEEVEKLTNLQVTNGAAMIADPRTGEILAMVGSKDYFEGKYGNYNVTTALRQPGSSIKPITFVTAFKQGYTPGNILLDTPVVFKNAWESYAPVNYDGKFHGAVTIRQALANSYNIPAVKMLQIVGIPNMIQTAKDLGITTFTDPDRYGLSLTLGGGEVKMVDMVTAYSTLAQMGVRHDLKPIIKVTDGSGILLEDNSESGGKRVLPTGVSYMITSILSDNAARSSAFGPNSQLYIPGYQVAVKTGTTDEKRDNWTFGYTPEFTVGAWVGNNDNSRMNQALSSGLTGASTIWNKIMVSLISQYGATAFNRPPDIAEGSVDGRKDLTLVGQTPKTTITQTKQVSKDSKQNEKETITFTDPLSTFVQGSGNSGNTTNTNPQPRVNNYNPPTNTDLR